MKLIRPSFEIMEVMGIQYSDQDPLILIEKAGRTCYKSEDKITTGSAAKFVKARIGGHESVIEHSAMTVRFICDRGVTHELVRHRLCSFSQESTRYCNYEGGVTFILPPWCKMSPGEYKNGYWPRSIDMAENIWADAMTMAENQYINLLSTGWSPQQARSVLPNSTKTEIVVTANFREWRHIFKLRCNKAAHPQMRELMIPLHQKCKELIPIIFDDIIY